MIYLLIILDLVMLLILAKETLNLLVIILNKSPY